MQRRNLIVLGAAVLLGLVAVLIANSWFSGVEKRQEKLAERQQMVRIAVASRAIDFAAPLTRDNVKMANWPADSVPAGAFTDVQQILSGRVATRPLVPGEPILASRISGSNGRASIANTLPNGTLAVAIPINEVSGVGGFVAPGDVVDVLLTRQIPGEGSAGDDKMTTVILEAVPVLGVDQASDSNKADPKVGKTATVQVDRVGAQKLALANQVGTISLALRNIEDRASGATPVVTAKYLGGAGLYIRGKTAPAAPAPQPQLSMANLPLPSTLRAPVPSRRTGPGMTVIRGTQSAQYEVYRDAGR